MRATDFTCFAVALSLSAVLSLPAAAKVDMEPVKPTPVAADLEKGKRLYNERCQQCHGAEGGGDGPAADFVYPRPRDFTLALFKVRATLSGQVPTDYDLFRAISEGLPGTSMPAWKKFLSDEERWQLVHYIKTFDTVGAFEDEPAKQQVAIGIVPKMTDDLVKRGAGIYEAKKCWQCHGKQGRGDGISAEGLKDDWGHPIRPVNFTKSWRFRGGDRLEDIYRTFTTGFNGTPMPSFAESIPEPDDRWALAAFVKSLSRPMTTGQVLKAQRIEGEIPSNPADAAWEKAELADFPLAGQVVQEPRWFVPTHDVVTAKALYNGKELAMLLVWDDGTHNKGDSGRPADQVDVQLPLEDASHLDGEKPYFLMGDAKHGVDLWRWDAGSGLERLKAFGADKMERMETGDLSVAGEYVDGQYRVILRRPMVGQEAGSYLPVALHLRDGARNEGGMKMAISSWSYLLLVPETPLSVYVGPIGIALLLLAGEILLARRLRLRQKAEKSRG